VLVDLTNCAGLTKPVLIPTFPVTDDMPSTIRKVQVTHFRHGFQKKVYTDENKALKRKLQDAEGERDALKSALHHSGLFDAASTFGLVPKRGRRTTDPSLRAGRVRAAAGLALDLGTAIQGPNTADNIVALVKQATAKDPSVPQRLMQDGMFAEEMVLVPDKRYKGGQRMMVQNIVSDRNAFIFTARTNTTGSAIRQLRELGGSSLISTPEMLQSWAMRQPELPAIKFLLEGWPIVWVPPLELLTKLMQNPLFSETIRWDAPYDKQNEKLIMWLTVTFLAQLNIETDLLHSLYSLHAHLFTRNVLG
jgi:hypothetical protein